MNGFQTTRMELGSAFASSSSSTSGRSESLNGLKFGKKIYFEDVGVGVQDKFGGGPPSLPPDYLPRHLPRRGEAAWCKLASHQGAKWKGVRQI
ncbi:Hypothetical predicted protein [Olea europaea subsp. europaea]|uniref:Uncharacterized protein n=1 Tax=Olea europaea subsp. europaea TaxID=158383 RepID=A0A8S0V2Y7_OLEEU|nr:Hypothetical predicted protein [Olea europaea subsp. europaea]